jgi:hypothetical protein
LDLNTLSQVAQIFGAVAVVTAIIFGIAQIRHAQRQRLDSAAIELVRAIQDRELTEGFRLLYALPEGFRAADLRAMGSQYELAAIMLGHRFETLGLLVFRESIPLRLVEELLGGVVVMMWHKLACWAADYRVEQGHDLAFEWFQWLAERIEGRGRKQEEPAYRRYRDWKPRNELPQ